MRNRYVIQVLLATFGFGLLLALVAVLQTPGVFSLQGAAGSSKPTELRQSPANTTSSRTKGSTQRTDNFKDECDPPPKVIDDCSPPEPQKICQRTSGSHEKTKTVAN